MGITIVELMVGVVVLSLLVLMVQPIFNLTRRGDTTMKRLDTYHHARRINLELASELKLATGILFPPGPDFATGTGPWVSQLVFRNSLHQALGMFIDEKDQLVLYNFDRIRQGRITGGRVLATKVKNFQIRRHGSAVVEYTLTFEQEHHEFTATNLITLVNVL